MREKKYGGNEEEKDDVVISLATEPRDDFLYIV